MFSRIFRIPKTDRVRNRYVPNRIGEDREILILIKRQKIVSNGHICTKKRKITAPTANH